MAFRRPLLLSLVILATLLISGGGSFLAYRGARAATSVSFTQQAPGKLYAGISSHPNTVADANPLDGTNGYCVGVTATGITYSGGTLGFTVVNAQGVQAGDVLSANFYDGGTPATTADDVYCAVIRPAIPAGHPPRPPVTLRWTYTENNATTNLDLVIPVVYVTLVGTNGVVGGTASVCTEGWDPTFLTGLKSNQPPQVPNALDVVVTDDWTISAGVKVAVFKQGAEQCVSLAANAQTADIDVTLNFWAVFDTGTVVDDRQLSVTGTDIVDIELAKAPELRHVIGRAEPRDKGREVMIPSQTAPPNVIGARHTACVIPSVPADVLKAADIQFSSNDGATATAIRVFTASGPDEMQGVPEDTQCFDWTSYSTGTQAVRATIGVSCANTVRTGADDCTGAHGTVIVPIKSFAIGWDSNGDGNNTPAVNGALIKTWNRIVRTVIAKGGNPDEGQVTNGSVALPVDVNLLDGTLLGDITLNEFVIGTRLGFEGPIDGVPVTIVIAGSCGYFPDVDPNNDADQPTVLQGVTFSGRLQFHISVDFDPGCTQSSVIAVAVQASYPNGVPGDQPVELETVNIMLEGQARFTEPPQVAWAGSIVTLTYAVSAQGGACAGASAKFVRSGGPGNFIDDPGVQLIGADTAVVAMNTSCTGVVRYESEQQGEVDISAFIDFPLSPERAPNVTKDVFTILYLEFEDLRLNVEPERLVSQPGNLDAQVRGWLMTTNPSPREALRMPDGRVLPAHRWVVPDDWQAMRGPDGFRPNWPGVVDLPPARVTLFMENEAVRNVFQTVKNGALGFFLQDANDEFSLNVDPDSGVPSVLGSVQKPRIISEFTDLDGFALVDTFGDLNLSFDDCQPNAVTKNPECKPDDVIGRTRYFGRVDYIGLRGKKAPIESERVETVFRWAGYKQVTVVDSPDDPQTKYVVAHLKDRDGFCDAYRWNNVLGVPVRFTIDAGDGIITEVQGQPSELSNGKRFATGTTFDTHDGNGKPINTAIAKPVVEDDECQAWIKVSNSLKTVTNVAVTFPAPPSPIPGQIRITGASCGVGGAVTVTNLGTNTVSLAGFGLRSFRANWPDPEEHLDLIGLLGPGESKTFFGHRSIEPWIFGADEVVLGNVPGDYVRLVWDENEISFYTCATGELLQRPIPATLALDTEGEIQLDVIVNFTDVQPIRLNPAWNLLTTLGTSAKVEDVLADHFDDVISVWKLDAATGEWHVWHGKGDPKNEFDLFDAHTAYWVDVKRPFTLYLPK